jgi:phosphoheptose isomerase
VRQRRQRGGRAAYRAEFVGVTKPNARLPTRRFADRYIGAAALGNDYGYERVFRPSGVEALAVKGDVYLVAICTERQLSVRAGGTEEARKIGCVTIGLTGAKGW